MSLPSPDDTIEAIFPNLASGHSWYEVASPPDRAYNCMAFAMGDTGRRWSPSLGETGESFFWPFEPLDDHIANFVTAFESEGYRTCEGEEPGGGFDKVALFVDDWGFVAHVAFKPGGTDYWLSKLGDSYDIKHEIVEAVGGSLYGWPRIFLCRRSGKMG